MAIFNPYIVFILKIGENYVTGVTSDIDRVVHEYSRKKKGFSLVFQKHFDDQSKAREYESLINKWDVNKKEALINGDVHD
ncbi:MAG: hypothetical protein R3345_12385 [Fulvivirga sp.]|nr:hypothetical protein [Fulvivirga sp.]